MPLYGVTSFCVLTTALAAQNASLDGVQRLLPAGAKVIETADLISVVGKPRALVLWMEHPTRHNGGEEYCGTDVHGHYWEGPARLSLVDSARHVLTNTVKILGRGSDNKDQDLFWLPFFVSDVYYYVPHPDAQNRGFPNLLNLRDLTGDGVAAEFVLFMYDACGIVSTSVLGYSPTLDRAIQYPVEVFEDGHKPEFQMWVEQVFATKPIRPGNWSFSWNPGHGMENYTIPEEVSFDSRRQVFVDRRKTTQSR